ncbi:MAG: hypothetical protein IPM18_07190 [Phycisphaerales bacterium]|nr:hypothetical protein [Phycisphaerales bacterium]
MYSKLFAITRNTFTETIRQPLFNVLLWVCVGLLILNPSIAGFSLGNAEGDIKIVMDVGLATLLLYGLFSAVFSATGVITREIESQTVLTVVSKPVSRPLFLLGKYLGVCGAVLVGYYFLVLVFLLTIRHGVLSAAWNEPDQPVLVFGLVGLLIALATAGWGNYVHGTHFPSTLLRWVVPLTTVALLLVLIISPKWQLQALGTDFGDRQILYAVLMTFCGVLILTAFAVTLATRFTQVVTLLLCCVVYVTGLLSDHFFGRPATAGTAWWYEVVYAIVPNFQFFWTGDALTQEQIIPAAQVAQVALYACGYSLGILAVGVAFFQTREVG